MKVQSHPATDSCPTGVLASHTTSFCTLHYLPVVHKNCSTAPSSCQNIRDITCMAHLVIPYISKQTAQPLGKAIFER